MNETGDPWATMAHLSDKSLIQHFSHTRGEIGTILSKYFVNNMINKRAGFETVTK